MKCEVQDWPIKRHLLPDQSLKPVLAEPHSSFGSVADLRTGGGQFDAWLGQYFLSEDL